MNLIFKKMVSQTITHIQYTATSRKSKFNDIIQNPIILFTIL